MLEQENPGRALKVVGNLSDTAAVTEAVGNGYCDGFNPPAAVIRMDY
jgi:hypothetical protein